MTPEPPSYELPDPMPWRALAAPLAQAEDALARLDERLRASPVREGWISRTHFTEGCAALWLEGELVHLEDLGACAIPGMDVSAPPHLGPRPRGLKRAPAHCRRAARLDPVGGRPRRAARRRGRRGRAATGQGAVGRALRRGRARSGRRCRRWSHRQRRRAPAGRSRFRICGGRRFDRAVAPPHRRRSSGRRGRAIPASTISTGTRTSACKRGGARASRPGPC